MRKFFTAILALALIGCTTAKKEKEIAPVVKEPVYEIVTDPNIKITNITNSEARGANRQVEVSFSVDIPKQYWSSKVLVVSFSHNKNSWDYNFDELGAALIEETDLNSLRVGSFKTTITPQTYAVGTKIWFRVYLRKEKTRSPHFVSSIHSFTMK